MSNRPLTLPFIFLSLSLVQPAVFAHTPVCYCYYEPDDTVLCEGGFSDGASAEGVDIRVLDDQERVLIAGKIDAEQTFSFEMPDTFFHVVFDAGDNHQVIIFQDEIE